MTENKPKLSPLLVILDAIGFIFIGIGLAETFAGARIVPESMRFEQIGITLIIIGAILAVPMLVWSAKRARSK